MWSSVARLSIGLRRGERIMTSYNVHFTRKSSNEKIGPIPATVTERKTCPPTCPFYDAGCYAGVGPVSWHWKKVTSGERGDNLSALCEQIEALPDNQIWRHNVAGDLFGDGEIIDNRALDKLIAANKNKRGFTYTHYPMNTHNAVEIAEANRKGFTINLSANNLDHADRLASFGIGPVVVVLPEDTKEKKLTTNGGNKVAVCPATYSETNCKECQLCAHSDRKVIVGFPAHGPQKKSADIIARSSND